MVRTPAIQGLAKCPSATTAKILVVQLKQLPSRSEAAKVIKSMGSKFFETELMPLLKDKDVFTRGEAVKLLQEIGTKKSLSALKELENSGLPFSDRAAREAIDAIELRESIE
jgi:HEAT repeat protein